MTVKQIGKPRWSDEEKARISASLIGNTRSVGRKHSDEMKAKISATQKGRKQKPVSEETRAKMSASAKARWLRAA
jgi:hypothetical protein